MKMEFGEKLKKAREEKGMTQQSLADQLYVTRQAVSRWECGARYPDLMTTKCIATILGVTIDSLVSDDEMKEFSEKQSLFDSQKSAKAMTAVFAVTAFLSLIQVIQSIGMFMVAFQDVEFVQDLNSNPMIFAIPALTLLMYLVICCLSGVGAVVSFKKEIDAKVAGSIGIIYYGIIGLYNLILSVLYGSRFVLGSFVLPVLSFVLAACAGMYFIGRKNRIAKVIYVGSVIAIIYEVSIFIYQQVNFVFHGHYEMFAATYVQMLCNIFTKTAVLGVLILQTAILEKRRKRQVKLMQ